MNQYVPSPWFLTQSIIGCCISTCLLFSSVISAQEPSSGKSRVQEDYELMKLFVETYEQIDSNYVKDVDRRDLIKAAIRGMLDHLDEYSNHIPKEDVRRFDQLLEQEFAGIGVDVSGQGGRLTVISPLPGTPAFRAGIRSGDVIVEVDGKSTENFRVTDAVKVLQGPPGRPVTIGIQRAGTGKTQQFTMLREVIQVPTVLGDHFTAEGNWEFMLNDEQKLGYIRMSHFSRHTATEIRSALDQLATRGMKGLVLDLRSNPGGLLDAAVEIADMFLQSGEIVSIKGRSVPFRSWKAGKRDGDYYTFPVAVLVNRYSASASEVLSACLQDNKRAIVVGERTWGKGSVQNVIRLESDDSALKLTTATYHRPSGVNIHRFPGAEEDDDWGVRPSAGFEVKFTGEQMEQWFRDRRQQESLRADDAPVPERTFTDVQLAKALEYLRDQLSQETPVTEPATTAPSATAPTAEPSAASKSTED